MYHGSFPHALAVFPHALAAPIMCVEVNEVAKINQIGKVLFAWAEFLPTGSPMDTPLSALCTPHN